MSAPMPRRLCCTAVSLAMAFPHNLVGASTDRDVDDPLSALRVASNEVLDAMRGGMKLPNGLELSFAIQQAVFVNNALVVKTSLNVPNIHQPNKASVATTVVPPTAPTIAPVTPPTLPTVAHIATPSGPKTPAVPTVASVAAPTTPTTPAVPTIGSSGMVTPSTAAAVAALGLTTPPASGMTTPIPAAVPTITSVAAPAAPTTAAVPTTGSSVVTPSTAAAVAALGLTIPPASSATTPVPAAVAANPLPVASLTPGNASSSAGETSRTSLPTQIGSAPSASSATNSQPALAQFISTPGSAAASPAAQAVTTQPRLAQPSTAASTNAAPRVTIPSSPGSSQPTQPMQVIPQQATVTRNTAGQAQATSIRLDQLSITTVQTAAGVMNLVQMGPGNTVSLNMAQLPSGVMNVIQNSLDNQSIRHSTAIQVSANSLSLLRASTFGTTLQRQLLGSIR
jgi:hypothetical protein